MIFSQPPAQRTLRGRPLGRPSQKRPPESTGASDSEWRRKLLESLETDSKTAALRTHPQRRAQTAATASVPAWIVQARL